MHGIVAPDSNEGVLALGSLFVPEYSPQPLPSSRPEASSRLFEGDEEEQLRLAESLAAQPDTSRREELLVWLRHSIERTHGLGFASRAARTCAAVVTEADAGWLLDLYFREAPASFAARLVHPYGLVELLDRVPETERAERVRRESHDPSAGVRRAAFEVACRVRGPERPELLGLFRHEEHPAFARRVRGLLAFEGLLPGGL